MAENREEKKILFDAIDRLPPDLREIVLLSTVQELNNAQIAEHLGVHPATVGRQLKKAYKMVRLDLEPMLRGAARLFQAPGRLPVSTMAVIVAAAGLSAAGKSTLALGAAEGLEQLGAPAAMGSGLSGGAAGVLQTVSDALSGLAQGWQAIKTIALIVVSLALIGGGLAVMKRVFLGPGPVSVVELWEDPRDVTRDDNDSGGKTDLAAVPPVGLGHPTHNRVGQVDNTIDTLDALGAGEESPIQGLSGLRWGGYTAARSMSVAGGNTHDIAILNLENLDHGRFGRQSLIDFRSHNVLAASDFPDPYDARTGSYVYTLFSSRPRGPSSVDCSADARFKVAWNYGTGHPAFRFLIQTEDGQWYRSTRDLPMIGVLATYGKEPWIHADMTRRQKIDRMQVFELSTLEWERVSEAAEADMNRLDDGGETPLGEARTGLPDLSHVTGMGVVITRLGDGETGTGLPLSIHLMGLMLESG